MRLNTLLRSGTPRPTQRLGLGLAATIAASMAIGGCAGTPGAGAPRLASATGMSSDVEAHGTVSRFAIAGRYNGTNYAPLPGR